MQKIRMFALLLMIVPAMASCKFGSFGTNAADQKSFQPTPSPTFNRTAKKTAVVLWINEPVHLSPPGATALAQHPTSQLLNRLPEILTGDTARAPQIRVTQAWLEKELTSLKAQASREIALWESLVCNKKREDSLALAVVTNESLLGASPRWRTCTSEKSKANGIREISFGESAVKQAVATNRYPASDTAVLREFLAGLGQEFPASDWRIVFVTKSAGTPEVVLSPPVAVASDKLAPKDLAVLLARNFGRRGSLGQDPNSDLGQDPNSDLGQDPNSDLGQDPNSDLGQDPNSDLGQDPNSDLGQDPNSDLGQDPNSDLSSTGAGDLSASGVGDLGAGPSGQLGFPGLNVALFNAARAAGPPSQDPGIRAAAFMEALSAAKGLSVATVIHDLRSGDRLGFKRVADQSSISRWSGGLHTSNWLALLRRLQQNDRAHADGIALLEDHLRRIADGPPAPRR